MDLQAALRRDRHPYGLYPLPSGPTFNAAEHLQLQTPEVCVQLNELGYTSEELQALPSSFGLTSCFSVLSAVGLQTLREEIQRLSPFAVKSPRIPRVLRGGSFRSSFLRDFCRCEELTRFVSELAGCALEPHPMTIMHAHTNFAPMEHMHDNGDGHELKEKMPVDQWHFDTMAYVLVLFVTPPEAYTGGDFQFFRGTIDEAQALLKAEGELPDGRVQGAGKQLAGCGVFQQGSQVMHRARGVRPGQERTTFVLSYAPKQAGIKEACNRLSRTYNSVDPLPVLLAEWTMFRLWMAAIELEAVAEALSSAVEAREQVVKALHDVDYGWTRAALAEELRTVAAVVEAAGFMKAALVLNDAASDVLLLRESESTMVYYAGAERGKKRKVDALDLAEVA